MKYLKLFESYKEVSDSLNELDLKYKKDKADIIDEYKSLIDDLLLDISDDYQVEFNKNYVQIQQDYLRKIDTNDHFLLYNFYFSGDKIDDFFSRLEDVLLELKQIGVSYELEKLSNAETGSVLATGGNLSRKKLKFVKNKSHEIYSKGEIEVLDIHVPAVTKFCLSISF